jgi:hypothetical protein
MALFDGMGGGLGGSPSAFTSPGIEPAILALLARIQNGGAQGAGGMPGGAPMNPAPQLPPPPQGLGAGGAIPHPGAAPGGMPQGAGATPQGMMGGLGGMGGIQQLLQMLQGGGGMSGGAGMPGMPGPGTGGLY